MASSTFFALNHTDNIDEQYAALKKHCEQGATIILELSLPRSHSTAWQIALAQADNVDQLNEPSYHADWICRPCDAAAPLPGTRPSSEYFRKINERLTELKKENPRPTLIVNDLSNALSLYELNQMLKLTKNVCITMRDPIANAHSLLTRFINDTLSAPGEKNISPEEALKLANTTAFTKQQIIELIDSKKINPEHILLSACLDKNAELTSEILVKAISNTVKIVSNDCFNICWENLKKQLDLIRTFPDTKIIIINGDDLIKNPESIMEQSSKAFGLSYTSKMIDHWEKATGDNFHCCVTANMPQEYIKNNAWLGPVRNSSKIEKKDSGMPSGLTLESFPLAMHAAIREAQKIFNEMTNSAELLHIPESPANVLRR